MNFLHFKISFNRLVALLILLYVLDLPHLLCITLLDLTFLPVYYIYLSIPIFLLIAFMRTIRLPRYVPSYSFPLFLLVFLSLLVSFDFSSSSLVQLLLFVVYFLLFTYLLVVEFRSFLDLYPLALCSLFSVALLKLLIDVASGSALLFVKYFSSFYGNTNLLAYQLVILFGFYAFGLSQYNSSCTSEKRSLLPVLALTLGFLFVLLGRIPLIIFIGFYPLSILYNLSKTLMLLALVLCLLIIQLFSPVFDFSSTFRTGVPDISRSQPGLSILSNRGITLDKSLEGIVNLYPIIGPILIFPRSETFSSNTYSSTEALNQPHSSFMRLIDNAGFAGALTCLFIMYHLAILCGIHRYLCLSGLSFFLAFLFTPSPYVIYSLFASSFFFVCSLKIRSSLIS